MPCCQQFDSVFCTCDFVQTKFQTTSTGQPSCTLLFHSLASFGTPCILTLNTRQYKSFKVLPCMMTYSEEDRRLAEVLHGTRHDHRDECWPLVSCWRYQHRLSNSSTSHRSITPHITLLILYCVSKNVPTLTRYSSKLQGSISMTFGKKYSKDSL